MSLSFEMRYIIFKKSYIIHTFSGAAKKKWRPKGLWNSHDCYGKIYG